MEASGKQRPGAPILDFSGCLDTIIFTVIHSLAADKKTNRANS